MSKYARLASSEIAKCEGGLHYHTWPELVFPSFMEFLMAK